MQKGYGGEKNNTRNGRCVHIMFRGLGGRTVLSYTAHSESLKFVTTGIIEADSISSSKRKLAKL